MPVTTINDYVQIQLNRNQTNSMSSLVQISQQLVARMNAEKSDQAINFTNPELVRDNAEKARLLEFKAKIADNLSAVGKAKNAIGWVKKTLDDMQLDLETIQGSTDADARAAAAASFDANLASINSYVDGANQKIGYKTVNLVGNTTAPDFTVDKLYIKTNPNGGSAFVEGVYMGSRYNIQDAQGYLWRYDEGSNAYVQYSSDGTGTPTGSTISADGLTLQSYDSSTGAVVFGGSGSLQGTVVKGGIGVLDSQFYNSFADDTSVQSALDDVNSAIDYVTSKGAIINADATLIQSGSSQAQDRITNLDREINSIKTEQLDESTAKSKAAKLKLSLAVNNINLTMQHNTSLIQNLVSLTEGQGPAIGVFGMMGY